MEHLNALGAGTRLEEYEIRNVLGQGGFGITYLADDTSLAIKVALKEYLPRDFAIRAAGSTVVPTSPADEPDYRAGDSTGFWTRRGPWPALTTRTSTRCAASSRPTARPTWSWSILTGRR